MKKSISVALAIVMMFSISVIAFAADSSSIELGKEYTVTLNNDTATYTFKAPEDGAYRISASIIRENGKLGMAYVTVGAEDNFYSTLSLYYYEDSELEDLVGIANLYDDDIFMAAKGRELTVSVESGSPIIDTEDAGFPPVKVKFDITKVENLREMKMGESYTVNGREYFLLRPTEDAVYDFWSYECTEVSIMDLDGNIYGDSRFGDYPVDVTLDAKAGELYGVFVDSDYSEDGEFMDSVIHVVDSKTIEPDTIDLEDITVFWRDTTSFYPVVYPVGANCKCSDLEVEVANDKIATVEYDAENDMFWVYGKRLGKTELTVTEKESGITRVVEIKVTTRIAEFFRNVFETILDIIDEIATK